jgi:serine/threonine-protein kinase RsbT
MADESELLRVPSGQHVAEARSLVRRVMERMGFSAMDVTRVVTATSELARNMVIYGGGGVVRVTCVDEGERAGVCVEFVDEGPGIASIDDAMRDGFSTGGGLGLGMPGSARLVDAFHVDSAPGCGTRVEIRKWKR